MKKEIKVSMNLTFEGTEDEFDNLKKALSHHIDWFVDMDGWPEVKSIRKVEATPVEEK